MNGWLAAGLIAAGCAVWALYDIRTELQAIRRILVNWAMRDARRHGEIDD